MPVLMREFSTKKIYDVQASFYDATFGKLTKKRVQRAVEHIMVRRGESVLDLGVGTGASLEFYPSDVRVVGVDLSPGMLREARQKMTELGIQNIMLMQADALHLPFADDSFDHVLITHVITVVSDPVAVIRQAQRVCKLGGRIVVLNHFQSTNRFMSLLEKWASPFCTKLGWRSDLALADLVRDTGMEVDYRFKLSNIDLWETAVVRNNKSTLRTRTENQATPEVPGLTLPGFQEPLPA